jgi:hypothetical protein
MAGLPNTPSILQPDAPENMLEGPFDNDGFDPQGFENPKGLKPGRGFGTDGSNMLQCPHDRNGFLPGEGLPDRTEEAHKGASGGSLNGVNTNWGPNRYGGLPGSGDTDNIDIGPTLGGAALPLSPLSEDRSPENAPSAGQISAADLKIGYQKLDIERTPPYDPDVTGEEQVGNPHEYGGFAGRPRGSAR